MLNIIHNPAEHCFQIEDEPGTAHLDYELIGDNHINFTLTYVPFKQRGKGIAEALVRSGLKWASDNRLNISTSCLYVEKYMADHSE
jgi:predicted GNAT family acetyltransferase